MSDRSVAARPAGVDDAPLLAQMLCDFNVEFDEPAPDQRALESRLRELLPGNDFWALVAGDPVQGLLTVAQRPTAFGTGPALYIEDVYVVPDARGQGIGGVLIARLFEEASARGASLIEIGVDESDVDAMRFYESHGFIHRDPEHGERAFYIYREL